MEAAHLLSAAEVLRGFSVTVEGGLRPEQVSAARERYGPNGESAGLAGAAGGRAPQPQFTPLRRSWGAGLPPPAFGPRGRAGSESSGNVCRCSWGSRTGCAATFGGVGWVPGLETWRRAPLPAPRDLCGLSGLPTATPDPIHSRKFESTALRPRPDPALQSAPSIQMHMPRQCG